MNEDSIRKAIQRQANVIKLCAVGIVAAAIGIVALNVCFWVMASRLDDIEKSQQRQEAAYCSNDTGNGAHDAPFAAH